MGYVSRSLSLLLFATLAIAQGEYTGVNRIVAIGDVHGDYDTLVQVLRSAGIIDKSGKWIGGATHLVQTGDVLDRGPDSRRVLDLLIGLEKQAVRSKGMVHALLGNHEAMNIYGDLTYVPPGEYKLYRNDDSEETRDRAYDVLADPAKKDDVEYHDKWYKEHPLGWVEHRQAFSPTGVYGKVLLEHDAVVKINDLLFLHGGISQKYVTMPIAEMNRKIRAELHDFRLLDGGVSTDGAGPLWDRGLAMGAEADTAPLVDSILSAYGVSRVVIGHTPTMGAVIPRFGGKVILIDVGLSKVYNQSPACLVVEDGKLFAMHRGVKIPLPDGRDLSSYMKQLGDVEPAGTNLRKFLAHQ
jgi:Calcineurin-like phosphoesterase